MSVQVDAMTVREALHAIGRITEDPAGRYDEVREFIARRGWAALCYTSWEACRKGELLPKETGRRNVKVQADPVVAEEAAKATRAGWTMDDWFALGRELAARNGGMVPHNMELRRIGAYQLYRKIKEFPEEFAKQGLFLDHKGGRQSNLNPATKKPVKPSASTNSIQGQA